MPKIVDELAELGLRLFLGGLCRYDLDAARSSSLDVRHQSCRLDAILGSEDDPVDPTGFPEHPLGGGEVEQHEHRAGRTELDRCRELELFDALRCRDIDDVADVEVALLGLGGVDRYLLADRR